MSRALLILANQNVRARAIEWIKEAADGTRIIFQEPKRTLDQNARMWAMLTDISQQATLGGSEYDGDEWKHIFMNALGHEQKWLRKLEGGGLFTVGYRTSQLSKAEMSDLMALMEAWGAQHGVEFHAEMARAA